MSGERNYFRKSFFGGFNCDDVVKYISKLANERNEYRSAKAAVEAEAKALADEIQPLRIDVENAKREMEEEREAKVKAELLSQTLTDEAEALRQEVKEARLEAEEERIARHKAEQDVQNLTRDIETLSRELIDVKCEADEGRVFKAEALESRDKVAKLEAISKNFADLEPAIENLREAFNA